MAARPSQPGAQLIIAVVSTLISAVALAGVVLSLLLQSRQVRISQLQTARFAQLELMKMGLDHPGMAAAALGQPDAELYSKQIFFNWHIRYLELAFDIKAVSEETVRAGAAELFEVELVREWWSWNRVYYQRLSASRRVRKFFTIVDSEFQRISQPAASQPDPSA